MKRTTLATRHTHAKMREKEKEIDVFAFYVNGCRVNGALGAKYDIYSQIDSFFCIGSLKQRPL